MMKVYETCVIRVIGINEDKCQVNIFHVNIVTSMVPMAWHIRLIWASDVLAAKFSNLTVFVFISGNFFAWTADFCSTIRWGFCCAFVTFWWIFALSLITVFCRPLAILCATILWLTIAVFEPTTADFCNALPWFCKTFGFCITCVLDIFCCNPWFFCRLETVFCIVVAIFCEFIRGFCITTLRTPGCCTTCLVCTISLAWLVACPELLFGPLVSDKSLVCIVLIIRTLGSLSVAYNKNTHFREKFILQKVIKKFYKKERIHKTNLNFIMYFLIIEKNNFIKWFN